MSDQPRAGDAATRHDEPCARLVPIEGTDLHTNCPNPPTWEGAVHSDWFGLHYCDDHKPEGVEGA